MEAHTINWDMVSQWGMLFVMLLTAGLCLAWVISIFIAHDHKALQRKWDISGEDLTTHDFQIHERVQDKIQRTWK